MMLTDNIKKQHINMTFKVVKVQGDTGFTMADKYEVVPSAIKRKVRRQRDRLDESLLCVTKDNKLVRMKPMVVTQAYTSRALKSALKRVMVQHILSAVRKADYESLVLDVVNDILQRDLWNLMNKMSPLKSVDIRILKYVGDYTGKEKVFIPKVEEKAEAPKKKEVSEEVRTEAEPVAEEPAEESSDAASEEQ
jgi:small subunit ribosomal protein S3Ae